MLDKSEYSAFESVHVKLFYRRPIVSYRNSYRLSIFCSRTHRLATIHNVAEDRRTQACRIRTTIRSHVRWSAKNSLTTRLLSKSNVLVIKYRWADFGRLLELLLAECLLVLGNFLRRCLLHVFIVFYVVWCE